MDAILGFALLVLGMAIGYELRDRREPRAKDAVSLLLWSAWIPLVILAGVT